MLQKNEGGRVYDLNISEKYVPEWGAWEVGREVISNAIDADRLRYKIETIDKDRLRVSTKTRPTLAQIKFIGGGTKDKTTGTIGCFGEGLKLAAMVCLRLGGNMRILFDQYEVGYEMLHDEDLGHRSILMTVADAAQFHDGMTVDIELEDISVAVSGKFLPANTKEGMIEKSDPEKMLIYNKGVFIAEKPAKSIWDWNLNTAVNRDRNVVDMWDLGNAIASMIDRKIDTKIAREILETPSDYFEVECIQKHRYNMGPQSAQAFLNAVKEKHGTDVVIATDDADANRLARRLGKKVILIDDAFRQIIQTISPEDRIKTTEEIVCHQDRLDVADTGRYDLSEINKLMDILQIPAEVYVFVGGASRELGLADFKSGRKRIYLNSVLFETGYRVKRLEVFIHELAHINAKASDGEFDFEDELGRLAGVLAKFAVEKEAS